MEGSPSRVSGSSSTRRRKNGETLNDQDVGPGKILWLPPSSLMPRNAVVLVRGNDELKDAGFDHPIVICSRPSQEPNIAHFHIITSFKGKTLDQKFKGRTKYQKKQRASYLPVFPTSVGAVAGSSGSKLPQLRLADGASLRWDSYVKVKDVYAIEIKHLRHYGNPITPFVSDYRLENSSLSALLNRSRQLSKYKPGPQRPVSEVSDMLHIPQTAMTTPAHIPPIRLLPQNNVTPLYSRKNRPRLSLVIPNSSGYGAIPSEPSFSAYDFEPKERTGCLEGYIFPFSSLVGKIWRRVFCKNLTEIRSSNV